jgi:hypothetical protein
VVRWRKSLGIPWPLNLNGCGVVEEAPEEFLGPRLSTGVVRWRNHRGIPGPRLSKCVSESAAEWFGGDVIIAKKYSTILKISRPVYFLCKLPAFFKGIFNS